MPWSLSGNLQGPKGDPGDDAESVVTYTTETNPHPQIVDRSLRIGPTEYPSHIPFVESGYLIIDRDNPDYDASVVFRTQGDTTGEIGHTGDGKNVNFKVVTGSWGSEQFIDSFKMVHPTGYVHVNERVGIGAEPTTALQVHGGTTVWPVALNYGSTVNTNCQQSDMFRLLATGNFTLANPTGMVDGQKVIWELYADGGTRTVTMGSAFQFGSDITGVTPIAANKADFIGAIYSAWTGTWRVIAYSKGY